MKKRGKDFRSVTSRIQRLGCVRGRPGRLNTKSKDWGSNAFSLEHELRVTVLLFRNTGITGIKT